MIICLDTFSAVKFDVLRLPMELKGESGIARNEGKVRLEVRVPKRFNSEYLRGWSENLGEDEPQLQ